MRIRARRKKKSVDFVRVEKFPSVRGTVVGVYAENSVGNLTHPGTSMHSHLVFTDPSSGLKVTGHLERLGLRSGSQLRLPKR